MINKTEKEIMSTWDSDCSQPMVTVVCCTYNHEKYIQDALDGFLNQITIFPYKIIVHDDASTDNTSSIVKEYKKKFPNIIDVILQKENQYSLGKSIVKSIVYPNIKSKYISLCEGDDYWIDKNKLQTQLDAMENNDCIACFHNTVCINAETKKNDGHIPRVEETCLLNNGDRIIEQDEFARILWGEEVGLNYPFQTSSYFFKKEVLNKITWTNEPSDINLMMACILSGKVYYINKDMSVYRTHVPNSTMTNINKSGERVYGNYLKITKGNAKFDEISNHKYHEYILNTRRIFLLNSYYSYTNLLFNSILKKEIDFFETYKAITRRNKIFFLYHFVKYVINASF